MLRDQFAPKFDAEGLVAKANGGLAYSLKIQTPQNTRTDTA